MPCGNCRISYIELCKNDCRITDGACSEYVWSFCFMVTVAATTNTAVGYWIEKIGTLPLRVFVVELSASSLAVG